MEPPTGPRDFVQVAITYAREAVADRKGRKFGKWIRLAAKRFLADLQRAKGRNAPFRFDEWWANDACLFAESMPHVEGVWDSPLIVLHESHIFFLVQLFGFRTLSGTRRFTSAVFCIARKNAKSVLASIVALYCLCCEGEVGPQVVSAGTTGQQARIVWLAARKMADATPDLREAFGVECWANAISCTSNMGSFRPINSKASTQDGLNLSACIIDEVHAHKSHDLMNVLKSSAGARRNPLFLFTTTEGYESPGPWPEQRRFSEQLLQGVVEADHYLAVIYAVDEQEGKKGDKDYRPADDDFDESKWIKANPLMTVNPLLMAEIRKEAREAKAMPGRHAEFKIKRLNRRSASASAWVDLTKWQRCTDEPDLEVLRRTPCIGALDLASTADMCSLALVWCIEGRWIARVYYWVPTDAVAQRTERGTVSYAGWVAAGYIRQTEGDVTDYDAIEADIDEIRAEYQIESVAYDPWNASALVNRLVEKGLPMVQFIQGAKSYHPAMQELERAYTSGAFVHGNNPVLTWNMANLVARRDANMNMAPDRKRSADKIDGGCCVLMGIGATLAKPKPEPKSVYETRGLLTV